jgi:hypothetical protein
MMPRYAPPPNLSPAAMRYLVRMGYDNKVFAAAVLNLAVKGFLTIKQQAGSYTLYLVKNAKPNLSPDESDIAQTLFDGRDQLWLDNENHTRIAAAISSLKKLLKASEEKVYFYTNKRYMIPAILITAAALVGIALAHPGPKLAGVIFMCFWLTIWTFAVAALIIGVVQSWKLAFAGGHASGGLIGKAIFLSLFSLPFIAGEGFGIFLLSKFTSFIAVAFLVASVLIHLLFHYLLKAPTAAGARLLDEVIGFKQFLGAVDGDRLNRAMPPNQDPQTQFTYQRNLFVLHRAWFQWRWWRQRRFRRRWRWGRRRRLVDACRRMKSCVIYRAKSVSELFNNIISSVRTLRGASRASAVRAYRAPAARFSVGKNDRAATGLSLPHKPFQSLL